MLVHWTVAVPWHAVDEQVAEVSLARAYVADAPARAPKTTSARAFPSMWAASVVTLEPVRSGWHTVQAMGAVIVVATWAACAPTETFVVTERPWMSTGGEAGPEGEVPWQKVQFVCQPLWHELHLARSVPWQPLHEARPPRLTS